jgi:hypothetical protein
MSKLIDKVGKPKTVDKIGLKNYAEPYFVEKTFNLLSKSRTNLN